MIVSKDLYFGLFFKQILYNWLNCVDVGATTVVDIKHDETYIGTDIRATRWTAQPRCALTKIKKKMFYFCGRFLLQA